MLELIFLIIVSIIICIIINGLINHIIFGSFTMSKFHKYRKKVNSGYFNSKDPEVSTFINLIKRR